MAKPKKAKDKPFKQADAVFAYVSACCNELAKKPSVAQVAHDNEKLGTLGKFRCGKCGKHCKVSRNKLTGRV